MPTMEDTSFLTLDVLNTVAWASRPGISSAKKHGRDAHATSFSKDSFAI